MHVNKWYGDNEDKNWNNAFTYNDLLSMGSLFEKENKHV